MTQKAKHCLYSAFLIILFAVLSVVNIYLILQKNNIDMILLYAIACFFFVCWLLDLFFSLKLFRFIYRIFEKPMSKSMTMDTIEINVASENQAHTTFQKMIKISPCIYLSILIIGIIILLLLC